MLFSLEQIAELRVNRVAVVKIGYLMRR